jgi:hypothetical protein
MFQALPVCPASRVGSGSERVVGNPGITQFSSSVRIAGYTSGTSRIPLRRLLNVQRKGEKPVTGLSAEARLNSVRCPYDQLYLEADRGTLGCGEKN